LIDNIKYVGKLVEVQRGRLTKLNITKIHNYGIDIYKRINYNKFIHILQCTTNDNIELNGNRGILNILKLINLTKDIIEISCAYIEIGCKNYQTIWSDCYKIVLKFKENISLVHPIYEKFDVHRNQIIGSKYYLFLIKNNKLYYDWPWGINRLNEHKKKILKLQKDHMLLFSMLIRLISNINNVMFFFGGEQPSINSNIILPLFSFAPKLGTNDMPFPFYEMYDDELKLFNDAYKNNKNFSNEFYNKHHIKWEKRITKAAFYVSYDQTRRLIFDQAVLRPDLYDVAYTFVYGIHHMSSWNMLSDEELLPNINKSTYRNYRNQIGYNQPILQYLGHKSYQPHHYKYIIVPGGSGLLSTSGMIIMI